ncbi:cysteine protease [Legionella nautarum]|uniref:Cysteine protease n=1 Tax=Legionella nautarum TaxID=45070 RepID=A0A0W0WVA5_9GAMM|nr:C1 family peptidase [Legionella nautarum]KTD36245.1 cysteine protease [Legionella nautarum]
MTFKKITTIALTLFVFLINSSFAEDFNIVGSIEHHLKVAPNKAATNQSNEKVIQLLQIELSNEEKERLANDAKKLLARPDSFLPSEASLFPNKVQLGMNKVPVLDQGHHGTCVTFAVTAALDALIGQGDYVSQVCHLQLGSYLEKQGYGVSGWKGSNTKQVIDQIAQYGIVNTEKQRKKGCGGINYYPSYTAIPESFIEPEQYYSLSELVFGKIASWSTIYRKVETDKLLTEVKQTLNSGDRVVFGVLLPRTDLGTVGAVGKYKTWFDYDTWVLTPEILKDVRNAKTGHVMIITGYDDNAIVFDNKGKKHTGLLTLRNSWSNFAGNYGDFYMSYDYFKLLAHDVKRISPVH